LARLRKNKDKPTPKGEQTMSGTAMQAILWIVAGGFLALLMIRRGKRKARG
jgi:hypothetical protein